MPSRMRFSKRACDGAGFNTLGPRIDGDAIFDESGKAVAMNADGSILAISAPLRDSALGQVRVYNQGTAVWDLTQSMDGTQTYDQFGAAVSL